MGYAALVTMQHRLKSCADFTNAGAFEHASTLNYVGNLIFRLAHNVVFSWLTPRQRVHLSLLAMVASMAILAFATCIGRSNSVTFVLMAYLLGGVSIGTFESNLLSSITPLGHATKKWAVIGIPLGFNLISVGGFVLLLAGVPLVMLYALVGVSCLASMALFRFHVPAMGAASEATGAASERSACEQFGHDLRSGRAWLPSIAPHALALCADMFTVTFFSATMLYVLNDSGKGGRVALLGQADHPGQVEALVPHDAFFAVYNCFSFAGDTLSRYLVYRSSRLHPPGAYLALSALGATLCLIKVPLLAPLGTFCIFAANGAIYATSTKHIDSHVDRSINLTALSLWLFIGDLGSVAGSNTWPIAAGLLCRGVHAPHMCLPQSR